MRRASSEHSGASSAERRRILFLSHTHTHGPFRVGSHHYARSLARGGAEVVHLSTPISVAHRITGRVSREAADAVPSRPLKDADGVTHVVPRTVLPRPLGRFRVAAALERTGIRPEFDTVFIDQPLLWDDSVRGLSRRLVYRPTDLYPTGVKARAQRQILDAADGIVATSTGVLEGLGSVALPTLILENGVDAARFLRSDSLERPEVCVYVGALDSRFDWQQLNVWARAHSTTRFLIAGPSPATTPDVEPNVELLGSVDYNALPRLLHTARVGLLPLSDDPLNSARSPMKLHEYLAAGLAVLARETPVIHPAPDAGLFTYTGAADAGAALRRALAWTSPNSLGVQRAAAESWEAKTDALTSFIDTLPVRAARP